jgi:LAO/AO transport system kinase
MIDMDQKKHEQGGWIPPILKLEAVFDKGTAEFLEEIEKHRLYLTESVPALKFGRKTKMMREELADMVRNRIIQEVFDRLESSGEFDEAVAAVLSGKIDPYTACDNLVLSKLRQERGVPLEEDVRGSREEKSE